MCRSCGALVGAGESICAQCGAPLVNMPQHNAAAHGVYDLETVRFARAVFNRPYIFTIIFLVANFFVFLLMWHSSGLTIGNSLLSFPSPILVAYGAKLNFLIKDGHQLWRFVTPMFIHVGLVHLMVNMYSLWMVGPYVEKLYGSAKFVVFWVLTGVAGVMASYLTISPKLSASYIGSFLFKAHDNPSAGASGALFGMVGVLFVFGIKFRHELPEGFKRAFGTGLLPMIMINLFIGFLGHGLIDNAAHLGGFASGAGLALVVGYKRPGTRANLAIFWHILQALALVLVATSFLMVARHFPREMPAFNVTEETNVLPGLGEPDFIVYINAINSGQEALVKALNERDASGINKAIEALDRAPRLDEKPYELRNELKALLVRAGEYAKTPTPDARARRRAQEEGSKLVSDFKAWSEKLRQWIKTDGKKYGLRFEESSSGVKDSSDKNIVRELSKTSLYI